MTNLNQSRLRLPRWLANFLRDLRVFGYLFPWGATLMLLLGLFLTAYLFWLAHRHWQGEYISPIKALFAVINMTFFQLTFADMPSDGRLDIFPVVVPLVGLPLFTFFGLKVINVIRVFFVRAERGQEWQKALIASTVDRHILVCGLGRIGYRVAKTLMLDYDQPVTGINDTPSELVQELLATGMPVILGSADQEEVLKNAGAGRASVVVVCTNQDWVNLEAVAHIRQLNPRARVILRLFEDELADEIKAHFRVDAIISRSAVAALSFTYAAIGGKIVETFKLAGKRYVLAQVPIEPASPLVGQTIIQVAREQDVTVVCHNRGAALTVEPRPETRLEPGDNLFVFTTVEEMIDLIEFGGKPLPENRVRGPVMVCGLGHTGYRVATNLHQLGIQVTALDFEAGRLSPRLSEWGIPVKFGDLRWSSFLTAAGVGQATAIVSCTEDDMTNLQVALRARQLNPNIRVVMRIFNDELNEQLRQTFGVNAAYSTSALAGPDFVSAALNRMDVRQVDIGDTPQMVVRLEISMSTLYGMSLHNLQQEDDLTLLVHIRAGQVNIPPNPETRLQVGDEIIVLATGDKLADLNRRNRPALQPAPSGPG